MQYFKLFQIVITRSFIATWLTYFSLLLSKVISAEELFFLIRGKQEENIYVRKSALQSFSLISTAGRVLSKLTSSMKEDKQSTVNHHDSSSTNISLQLSSLIKRISKNGHLAVLCFTERNKLIELGTCPCTRGGKKKHLGRTCIYGNGKTKTEAYLCCSMASLSGSSAPHTLQRSFGLRPSGFIPAANSPSLLKNSLWMKLWGSKAP